MSDPVKEKIALIYSLQNLKYSDFEIKSSVTSISNGNESQVVFLSFLTPQITQYSGELLLCHAPILCYTESLCLPIVVTFGATKTNTQLFFKSLMRQCLFPLSLYLYFRLFNST